MSDALGSLEGLQPRKTPDDAAPQLAASVALDGDEPVLGPLGRRLVVVLVVVLATLFIVASVWLLGYLAYTTPPVPGGS
jgi:hypothetical protein